jgi:hypothetical protein
MILSTPAIPEEIVRHLPQIRQWAENARNDGFVSIGVVGEAVHVLPGFLETIEVSDSLLEDSVSLEGQSGSVKVIHGWKDCDVSITLTLIDIPGIDTANCQVTPNISRYDCLAEIAGWFKKMKDGKPQIYTVHHPHIVAWGAREFIYSNLKSSQSRKRQTITCTLEFDEYDSTTGKSQDRQIGINIAEQSEAETPPDPPVDDGKRRGLGELEEQYAKR